MTDIVIVLAVLSATVILFTFDFFRSDLVAIIGMILLGLSGVLEPHELFSGFSSNAVISIVAVMVMAKGMMRTGFIDHFSKYVSVRWGNDKQKVTAVLSALAGFVSGFVQNVGAAALFLPGVIDVSRRTKIPLSGLLIPVAVAIILGGSITMVGSGHLILMNDLIESSDIKPFSLFSIAPVGFLLLFSGIAFFYFFGNKVLPKAKSRGELLTEQERLIEALQLPYDIWYYSISEESLLNGKTTEESAIWGEYNINVIGISDENNVMYAPWRKNQFKTDQVLALLGAVDNIERFANDYRLVSATTLKRFDGVNDPDESGFAEVIVHPRSKLVGKSIRQHSLRKRYSIEPLRLFSGSKEMRGDFSDHVLSVGDTIIVYGLWEKLIELKESSDFIVATPIEVERKDKSKTMRAFISIAAAVILTFFGFPISVSLLTGALLMVIIGVLNVNDAYDAIDWKVIFLIAGLLALGSAMNKAGASEFIATELIGLTYGQTHFVLILIIAVVTTLFSIIITNIGAVVVLTPLIISIATVSGLDPRPLVMLSAITASNSFILPTQPVNAIIMSAGGYRNRDFFIAGGAITLIFIAVVVLVFTLFIV